MVPLTNKFMVAVATASSPPQGVGGDGNEEAHERRERERQYGGANTTPHRVEQMMVGNDRHPLTRAYEEERKRRQSE